MLPGGVAIGQIVQYLPGPFDVMAYSNGQPGPVAAIITAVDQVRQTVNLTLLPDGKPAEYRPGVPYFSGAAANENTFKRPDDFSCTQNITNLNLSPITGNFRVTWTPPAESAGVVVTYRENTTEIWKVPNAPGNLRGVYGNNFFYLTNTITGVQYDIQVQNVCSNGAVSDGANSNTTGTSADAV